MSSNSKTHQLKNSPSYKPKLINSQLTHKLKLTDSQTQEITYSTHKLKTSPTKYIIYATKRNKY